MFETSKFTILAMISIAILLHSIIIGQSQESSFNSKVIVDNNGEKLSITAKFWNHSADTLFLAYELNTNKKSTSGKSKSVQSGEFISMPGSESILAKVGLNIEKEMNYEIMLKVFNAGTIISSDSLSFKSSQ